MAEVYGRWRKIYLAGYAGGERINAVSLQAEALFTRLILAADDYGNLRADPAFIRGQVAPLRKELTPARIASLVASLELVGLVSTYRTSGTDYLHLHGFTEYQKPPNGRRSRYVPGPEHQGEPQAKPAGEEGEDGDPVESEGSGALRLRPRPRPRTKTTTPEAVSGGGKSNKEPPGFPEFWEAYPRRVQKGAARVSFVKATAKSPWEAIVKAAERFGKSEKGRGQYCPYPATWLNQERWTDDPKEWKEGRRRGGGGGIDTNPLGGIPASVQAVKRPEPAPLGPEALAAREAAGQKFQELRQRRREAAADAE